MSSKTQAMTLEEHILLSALGDESSFYDVVWKVFPENHEEAKDWSIWWVADMDAGGISLSDHISYPGIAVSDPTHCRKANDKHAEALNQKPH
jgi:hypothetical protein